MVGIDERMETATSKETLKRSNKAERYNEFAETCYLEVDDDERSRPSSKSKSPLIPTSKISLLQNAQLASSLKETSNFVDLNRYATETVKEERNLESSLSQDKSVLMKHEHVPDYIL